VAASRTQPLKIVEICDGTGRQIGIGGWLKMVVFGLAALAKPYGLDGSFGKTVRICGHDPAG
jgi:hypothetical protein